MTHTCLLEIFLLAGTLSHTFMLLSTSFVEEEHQILYFLTTSVHALILVQTILLLLEGYRNKHVIRDKCAANINSKNYTKIGDCGEKFKSNSEDDISSKLVETNKYRNEMESRLSHSNDSSYSETQKRLSTKVTGGSLQYMDSSKTGSLKDKDSSKTGSVKDNDLSKIGSLKDKEPLKTGHAGVYSGGSAKGSLKRNCEFINLIEFLHVFASVIGVLVLLRVLRRWNQTGNKWLDVSDFGDWLIL
jgi:hypothetical protein